MSAAAAFRNSPAKRGGKGPSSSTNGSSTSSSSGGGAAFTVVGERAGKPCPDEECGPPRGELLLREFNGRPFASCSNNNPRISDDKRCCVTANRFGPDKSGKKTGTSIDCLTCCQSVAESLSLGRATGEKDSKNKAVYDNVHLFFEDCAGKRGKDPNTEKKIFLFCTSAKGDVVGKTCEAYDPRHKVKDLKIGCTGKIKDGDVIVRGFASRDQPQGFHLRCSKRAHQALVKELIAEKKLRKSSGTTAEEQREAPSPIITPDLEDI